MNGLYSRAVFAPEPDENGDNRKLLGCEAGIIS
jgi:hypothetical protein